MHWNLDLGKVSGIPDLKSSMKSLTVNSLPCYYDTPCPLNRLQRLPPLLSGPLSENCADQDTKWRYIKSRLQWNNVIGLLNSKCKYITILDRTTA